jgi:hypothetical protein
MRTAGRQVDAHHAPVDTTREVGVSLDGTQDPVPHTVRRPASMPFIDGLPTAETLGKIPPRYARPNPEQDPVEHLAVIVPPAATSSRRRQVWLQSDPLSIRQITPPHAGNIKPPNRQSHDPPDKP